MAPGKASKTKIANVRFTVKCDEKKAKRLFGQSIASLAFGSMQEIGGSEGNPDSKTTVFGYESLKPKTACATHLLSINDLEGLKVEPKITGIKPAGEDSSEVHIEIMTPVACTAKLAAKIVMQYQEVVDLKFELREPELPNIVVRSGKFGNPKTEVVG